ncbi:hypothetical protein IQ07DRAFT_498232 [Pyrenochaeta sp. DS3sAY3a]|nr:hypothetical protein IQ07DRAFT_498232 [Pyrenochaeta sp. DS3sAY3a]
MRTLYILSWTTIIQAHMSLWYPPPLGGAHAANKLTTQVDEQLNFPYGCCDSEGAPTLLSPGDCRGHLDLLDAAEGQPQVTWKPGNEAYFQLSDHTYSSDAPGSTHFGGSCQVGFSTDRGRTWKVAASYHGDCPHRAGDGSPESQKFYFKVPIGMPQGSAIFAWIWLNRENESFMNCASVEIGEGSRNVTTSNAQVPFESPTHKPALESERQLFSGSKLLPESSIRLAQSVKTPSSSTLPTRPAHDNSLLPTVRHHHGNFSSSYSLIGSVSCECKSSRHCTCDPPSHLNRSQLEKRAPEACSWDSAPEMVTSYFTVDARCRPGAKLSNPTSNTFEFGWEMACGIVNGDGAYPIEIIKC